ncbi:hypothetical protein PCANC_24840 [Puccinia coronata f. sp. avenae]|uniref:Uncharacterized protein n=1 Tax=Puccinia coronata f. sp. avenae TaxID=200324 RepID=A0A2N5U1T9_9BASI|nr:hypothetical protein PCANC_24840 [Puccinia coronata f. sp. avenae]
MVPTALSSPLFLMSQRDPLSQQSKHEACPAEGWILMTLKTNTYSTVVLTLLTCPLDSNTRSKARLPLTESNVGQML